ncbi:hypothetical protein M427DRAFT_276683 [Gonapodya prolifera JEL478]|uniref:Uncharacterized protein n=1 Tax=Gonapodya prolifera (strain JEL478) TaxID=1344416 RepID=A0A139AYZ5_GONPJ|nr:hypothetical protein M427DRAFT_276683 [Gonapodya prolifera JEL478]|eukprot:KXS21695.1 hypothetical protein M427DRAFT_276683 [Gonapodya prolifera JEL478]
MSATALPTPAVCVTASVNPEPQLSSVPVNSQAGQTTQAVTNAVQEHAPGQSSGSLRSAYSGPVSASANIPHMSTARPLHRNPQAHLTGDTGEQPHNASSDPIRPEACNPSVEKFTPNQPNSTLGVFVTHQPLKPSPTNAQPLSIQAKNTTPQQLSAPVHPAPRAPASEALRPSVTHQPRSGPLTNPQPPPHVPPQVPFKASLQHANAPHRAPPGLPEPARQMHLTNVQLEPHPTSAPTVQQPSGTCHLASAAPEPVPRELIANPPAMAPPSSEQPLPTPNTSLHPQPHISATTGPPLAGNPTGPHTQSAPPAAPPNRPAVPRPPVPITSSTVLARTRGARLGMRQPLSRRDGAGAGAGAASNVGVPTPDTAMGPQPGPGTVRGSSSACAKKPQMYAKLVVLDVESTCWSKDDTKGILLQEREDKKKLVQEVILMYDPRPHHRHPSRLLFAACAAHIQSGPVRLLPRPHGDHAGGC